jgi:hypothetical protein
MPPCRECPRFAACVIITLRFQTIRSEEDVDDLRRAFVKVTSFNLEFAGRRARLGVIEDLSARQAKRAALSRIAAAAPRQTGVECALRQRLINAQAAHS